MPEYLIGVIDDADTSGATLVVIILRTPGGLLDSTSSIVSRMITSRAPVVVFVGPSGARAASAGFVLTIAADVAADGARDPYGCGAPGRGHRAADGRDDGEEGGVGYRGLCSISGRGAWPERRARRTGGARVAPSPTRKPRSATPPLVDVIATDVDDLLRQLDGRTVLRFDGRSVTLHTRDAAVRRVPMSRRQRFLGTIADPQIAYLLLTLGTLGLTIELWNPGAIVPGVAGGLCLLLAFFAFQILPVNMTGLLLILFGLGLLILELKVSSFGALGIGGAISLIVGSRSW